MIGGLLVTPPRGNGGGVGVWTWGGVGVITGEEMDLEGMRQMNAADAKDKLNARKEEEVN